MKNADELIIFSIEKLSQINRKLFWDISRKNKLSPIQMQFIEHIARSGKENCTVTKIAETFELKKATVSDSIKTLIVKGYLTKIYDEEDKRIFYLATTKKCGKELDMLNQKNEILVEAIRTFSHGQKEEVVNFFMHLLKNLYDEKVIHNANICLTCRNFEFAGNKHHRPVKKYHCSYLDRYFSDADIKNNCMAYMQK